MHPQLTPSVPLGTPFQISMLSYIDFSVSLHCLQNKIRKKKKKVVIKSVKNHKLDADCGRTVYFAELQIQIQSYPIADPLKKFNSI